MVSPLRVHLLYWAVFGFCCSATVFLMWQTPKWTSRDERSMALTVISVVGMGLSQIVATLVCRAAGYSLARRVETQLKGAAERSFQETVEIRSYSSQQTFKMMAWVFLGGAGLVVLMAPILWSHGREAIKGFYFVLPLFLVMAGFGGVVSRLEQRGRFVARADSNGVESGEGAGRRHFEWEEIESAVYIENFDLFGSKTTNSLELRNAQGHRTIILFFFVPPEQERQFCQVVSGYFMPSVLT